MNIGSAERKILRKEEVFVGDLNKNFAENANNQSVERSLAEIDAAIALITKKIASSEAELSKPAVVSGASKSKLIGSAIFMIVSVLAMVFSSFAYFTASTNSAQNRIATGTIAVDFVGLNAPGASGGSSGTELDPIKFLPGYVEMRDVYVNNTGDAPIYIRAKTKTEITLSNTYSAYSDMVDPSLVIFDIDTEKWVLRDGYYYYHVALEGGKSSPELFNKIEFSPVMGNIYKDSIIEITVLFEMVQASNNGATVFDAVGWTTSSEGGEP